MSYTCTARSTDEEVLVHVTGDVDFAVSDLLWKDVEPWLVPTKSVVVDCSGITFLDSMGLRTLLRIEAVTRENGVGLTLADPSRPVRRVLELAGVESIFTVSGSSGSGDSDEITAVAA
jgi:stage II sporulation protein AA (anti-sigma F factor antagonist)